MTSYPRDVLTDAELDEILGSRAPADPAASLTLRRRNATAPDPQPTAPVLTVDTAAADRQPFDPVKVTLRAALAAIIVGLLLTVIGGLTGVGPGAPPKAHAAAAFGGTCRGPLSSGHAVITRSTIRLGHRYHTSVVLRTTGDQYRLVTDRGVASNAITGIITRVAHGATGPVDAPRTWGFSSPSGSVVVHVAYVDTVTGRYGFVSC